MRGVRTIWVGVTSKLPITHHKNTIAKGKTQVEVKLARLKTLL